MANPRFWGRFFSIVVFLFSTGFGATSSMALEDEILPLPWQMDADRIIHLSDQEIMRGEGNVILRRIGEDKVMPFVIKAEFLEYGVQSGEVMASGGMEVQMGQDTIIADEAKFNLSQQIGRLSNARIFFADHNLYFSGSSVEKTGEFSYQFSDTYLTSCPIRPGKSIPWGIKARKTSLTLDEYAVLRDATFRIHGVPVFYTPYLIMPAKVSRQSGLLFPEISNSNRDGLGLITPIFVNLAPSFDATLIPGYLGKRGAFLGAEFRYAAAPYSVGSLMVQYLDDRTEDIATDDYKSDGYLRTVHDRYWLRGKFDHLFDNKVQARLDLDLLSDPDLLMEYRAGISGFDESHANFMRLYHRGLQEESNPLRESTLQISKAWSAAFMGAELRGVDDTGYALPGDVTRDPVQTLPRLLFNGRSPLYGPLGWKWDSEYDYFWRQDGLGSHRLDMRPALTASLPLGPFVEGRVEGGLRQTIYQVEENGVMDTPWENSRYQERTLWSGTLRLASLFYRNFSWRDNGFHRFSHLIRPSFGYDFLSRDDQSNLPEFDQLDRLERKNKLQLALHQYFSISSTDPDGNFSRRDLGFFKISTDYDLHEARRDMLGEADVRRPFTDILFDLDLRPLEKLRVRYKTSLNVYGEGVPKYELRTRYSGNGGDMIAVDYRYVRGAAHELDLSVGVNFLDDYYLKVSTKRSLITDRTIKEKLRFLYHPSCWAVEVNLTRTEDYEMVMVLFSLDGIGKVFEWGTEEF